MFTGNVEMDSVRFPWWHILVKARVTLLPTAAGGRRKPVYERYSPNHKLRNGLFAMGMLKWIDGGQINPGESALVEINFLVGEPFHSFFKEGLAWDIHEGSIKVGTGEILSVIEAKEVPK